MYPYTMSSTIAKIYETAPYWKKLSDVEKMDFLRKKNK